MDTKVCTRCGEEMPATTEFYYETKVGSGKLRAACRGCTSAENSAWQRANRESNRAATKSWQAKNRHKVHAQQAARSAVKHGLLPPATTCSECGATDSVGYHHDSYAEEEWLNVRALCNRCHMQWHRKNGWGL